MAKKALLVAAMFAVGCYTGMDSEEIEFGDSREQSDLEVDEIIGNLVAADFPEENIRVLEDNTVIVGGDAVVTLEASREMAGIRRITSDLTGEADDFRQYRTNNLVDSPQTISVYGYTAGSVNNLDATMQTALSWAVDNYNQQNLGLTFTLDFGSNYQPADIVVYRTGSGAGGSAGFPSGGAPYKWVQILSDTSNYGTNVVEHVITHEIGHCLGFRHTDYFNRSLSCGSGGNEGDAGVGANHISGTPVGTDYDSIMQACFSSGEDGEFGPNDEIALDVLYGGGGGGGGPVESPTSCYNKCNQNAGQCWCDNACHNYGDCCADKVAECGPQT